MQAITKKDEIYRKKALEGNIFAIIFSLCMPLALFQFLTQIFNVVDTLMASHISAEAVSTVAYLVQINNMINAIGTGLAAAAGIIVAGDYGKGDYNLMKRDLSTVVAISLSFSLVILMIIPFTPAFLRLIGTPEEFVALGSVYFSVLLVSLSLNCLNAMFISIERARGNSRFILFINLLTIATKLSLTAFFIYVLDKGIVFIALSTLLSFALQSVFAVKRLFFEKSAFSFSRKAVNLKKETVKPIFTLALPVILEKIAFSYGKALVNRMSASYGTIVVGAAGISNNMSGLMTSIQVGFQDGGSALISQNCGHGNQKRTVAIFLRLMTVEFLIGIAGNFIYLALAAPISHLFALSKGGYSPEFQATILTIFRYEILGCLCLSFAYASNSFFFGTGRTKLTLLVNFMRIFAFRLPVIYSLTHFSSMGEEAVGITMLVSNTLTGLFALSLSIALLLKLKKNPGALSGISKGSEA
jgi:Na+-driven multidrug efflux pump